MVASSSVIAALLSTGFISLAPNLILFAFPGYASSEDAIEGSTVLSMGQALAAGGLLGDVFLHTLPEAASDEDAGIWVLVGFTIFLVMDMFIRALNSDDADHGHHHCHAPQQKSSEEKSKTEKFTTENASHEPSSTKSMFTSSILLNLTADALHNFTDGLAIGVSFAVAGAEHSTWQSLLASRGGLATLSILFHEIPHELGDYCILLKNGFSKTQAIGAQFGTAIAAFIGTLVGLWAASLWSGVMYITAGGFIYLAAVTIMPQVLEERKTNFSFRISQLAAFLIGIGFLYAVALLESSDGGGDGHSHGHHAHLHKGNIHEHTPNHHEEMRHHHYDHHDDHNHHHHQHEL